MDFDSLFFYFLLAVLIGTILYWSFEIGTTRKDKDFHIKNLPPKNDDEGEK